MKIESFDLDKKILVVAEIGNNHEGSYRQAEKLVRLAARAGVGAVKFQVFKTEHYVSKKDLNRFNQLKQFELTCAGYKKLSKIAREEGLLFICTPFDLESVFFLRNIVSAYKISSGDNNFYPLISKIAETGKPIVMSSGLADLKQLKASKSLILSCWDKLGIRQELAVLHCVTSYPVLSQETNLKAILTLRKNLGCTIGFSDHTLGIEAAVLSVALGARIIEKHFTSDKNYSSFRDHKISADPKEMVELIRRVNEADLLLGSGQKLLQPSERKIINLARRSIVAKYDLQRGKKITYDDLDWVRPAGGLPPGEEYSVLGKYLKKEIKKGDFLFPLALSRGKLR